MQASWCVSVLAIVSTTAATIVPSPAGAQVVVGHVVDASQKPVAAAIVTATGSNGSTTTVLSSSTGQFVFQLANTGVFDMHVARVGYASVTTVRIPVGASDTVHMTVVAPVTPIALASTTSKGAYACRVQPDSALITSRIWIEVRKALLTTQVPRQGSSLVGEWLEFERVLDSSGTTVKSQRVSQVTHSTPKLFRSIPANTITTRGFVISDASGTAYFAPDVALLLSPEFEASHCVKLASLEKGKPDEIGVEFAPARKQREVHDIAGTIWIERATGALRMVEFIYTGLPELPSEIAGGGQLVFARLSTGEFALTSWVARLPQFDVFKRNMNSRDDDSRYARSDTVVRAVQEVGGTLQQVRDGTTLIYVRSANPLTRQPLSSSNDRAFDPYETSRRCAFRLLGRRATL